MNNLAVESATAVSTRIRNGRRYIAHSAHQTRPDALDIGGKLRAAGRTAYATEIRPHEPVILPGGAVTHFGWAVWAEEGRAVVFSVAPDCSAPMTDAEFAALDAQEVEAREAVADEAHYSRNGW